jgi:hypothetical protein
MFCLRHFFNERPAADADDGEIVCGRALLEKIPNEGDPPAPLAFAATLQFSASLGTVWFELLSVITPP